jgi:hypothetical protein
MWTSFSLAINGLAKMMILKLALKIWREETGGNAF